MSEDAPLLLILEPRVPLRQEHIPLGLHLRIRLGLATERERAEYQNARWQGLKPSPLSVLAIQGMKGLVPLGLGALVLCLALGASKGKPRMSEPAGQPAQVSVVRTYRLDVRIGDAHLQDDWQDTSGKSPDAALFDRLDQLATHWTSK